MIGLTLCVLLMFGSLAAVLAPESHFGKGFQRLFVDRPARLLSRGPAKIIVAAVVMVALIAIAAAAPEIVALVGLGDLSIYLDLVVVSVVLGAAKGFRTASLSLVPALRRCVASLLAMPLPLGRQNSRVPRVRRPQRPKPDDDAAPWEAWAIA